MDTVLSLVNIFKALLRKALNPILIHLYTESSDLS